MTFAYLAIREELLIKLVNNALAQSQTRVRAASFSGMVGLIGNIAILKTTRGATLLAPLRSSGISGISLRAVHRVINKNAAWGLMPNGQATKNLHTLTFTGETNDFVYASKEDIERYFKDTIPNQPLDYYAERVRIELTRHNGNDVAAMT